MNNDNYYWLFSAAAQSIAALIAFLMAGVALAFSMMDRLVDQDDTLQEVVESLRRRQHKQVTALAAATGIAILSSLLAVYLNPSQSDWSGFVRIIAASIDLVVVISSVFFVASIIRPSRYSRAAKREYAASRPGEPEKAEQAPAAAFFREFIELEQGIRDYLKQHDLYVPSRGAPRMSFSFRQMVDALYQNEKIDKKLKDLFLEINKFRNLLFHGHIEEVEESVMQRLRKARSLWDEEKDM